MVLGTRGRYAGSRRHRDGGGLLISYSLYLSPSTHNGARDQGAVMFLGLVTEVGAEVGARRQLYDGQIIAYASDHMAFDWRRGQLELLSIGIPEH